MTDSILMSLGSAVVLMLVGCLLLWAGKSAAQGNIGRNRAIGIRTRWTLASDEAWEAGHQAGRRGLKIGSLGLVSGAILAMPCAFLPRLGVSEGATNSIVSSLTFASCIWLLCWVLAAAKAANRAAKALLS
ncbi:hypothetical protein BJH93_00580 [Kocuria polaris]|nr:hypothetical protein [Kocuria polaris]